MISKNVTVINSLVIVAQLRKSINMRNHNFYLNLKFILIIVFTLAIETSLRHTVLSNNNFFNERKV